MPKMKTKRAAAKRFKLTATGKIKIKKQGLRHILTKKSRNIKRDKGITGYVDSVDERQVKRMLPYG
jgi:large subunit ribosomal protein L35